MRHPAPYAVAAESTEPDVYFPAMPDPVGRALLGGAFMALAVAGAYLLGRMRAR
jgi:hypothetical protein